MSKITPIILSGGGGSRLWPVSRKARPKPFMWIDGNGSLLHKTVQRIIDIGCNDGLTVTNEAYYQNSLNIYSEFEDFNSDFILEPLAKNTSGAIGFACKYLISQQKDDVVLVLPSDHIIENVDNFKKYVEYGYEIAKNDKIVTFGIKPTKPHTGYGYIKQENEYLNGYKVEKFVEKPNLDKAKEYLQSGEYFWNAGIFMFKSSVYLAELEKYSNHNFNVVMDTNITCNVKIDEVAFDKLEDISIDFAVLEKSDLVYTVCADNIGWSDLGAWDSVFETLDFDSNNNRVKSEAQCRIYDSENTNVFTTSTDKLVVCMGLNDTSVIETRDAVLVCNNSRLQDIKNVCNDLVAEKHEAAISHRTVHRPWGSFTIIDQGLNYKVKNLEVVEGGVLSLQSHKHRSEHWVVVSGIATIEIDGIIKELHPNESIYIHVGQKHRLSNVHKEKVIIIETQTGDYLGEDDIIRYEDIYNRG